MALFYIIRNKPKTTTCQDGYISSLARDGSNFTCACGKGRVFDPDKDAYRAVASDPSIFQRNVDRIYIPELQYNSKLDSWGNADFTVRDTGEDIEGAHLDIFVGQGPGVLADHNNLANLYTLNQNLYNGIPEIPCGSGKGLGPVAVYQKSRFRWWWFPCFGGNDGEAE